MGKIIILDENTSNKIAAGEVIERPGSVVKELVENSIDAGANVITVEIKNGGVTYIKVTDNGAGIDEDDANIAFERHATSKIRNANDLEKITTLGFRGEALASIAAVSAVELFTRVQKNNYGKHISVRGGIIIEEKQTGCPVGTTFIVKELFYNTPARFKFLKKDSTEAGYISDIISRLAIGNPYISFRLISNGTEVIHTPGNNDLQSAIFSIHGKETAKDVIEIDYNDGKIKIKGYAGKPEIARATRNNQTIYINGRYIKSKTIASAIDESYKTFLMKNKYAFIVLKIELDPLMVDVNVHPAKLEVRFSDEQEIFRSVYHAINNALLSENHVKIISFDEKNIENKYVNQEFSNRKYSIQETLEETNRSEKCDIEGKELGKELINAENKNSKVLFENAKIIGQVFSTYILLQLGDELVMIDQHAAHERIVYERMKKKYENNEVAAQLLISPVVIELTGQENKTITEATEYFNKLGFIFENFGNNSIILRSVPGIGEEMLVKEAFMDIVDILLDSNHVNYKNIKDEALYKIACKAAIKANKKLDEIEIKAILEKLEEIENPYTCPHGRPVIIKITKYELEKKFKRVL